MLLDRGHLSFDDVRLTAFSHPVPIDPAHLYRLTMTVTGTVEAGLGQGGWVTAVSPTAGDELFTHPRRFQCLNAHDVRQDHRAGEGLVVKEVLQRLPHRRLVITAVAV